jgi:ribonuclease D
MQREQHLVDSEAIFLRLLETIAAEQLIGLDTESNGFHAYVERVCLIQIATRDADWAVDPLAVPLRPLVPLLADPAREVVLHAAEYDVLCLKRELGLVFGRIFDTHAAAKVLGIQRVGLGNLLEDELGVKLTVDEQRSDWGRRPLSPEQIAYAFADVQYLLPLRELLGGKLAAANRLAEAEAEFARLVAKEPRPREFDPEGWQKMKAARTLDGKGRAVLRELFLLRDRRAREVNRPPFKVLSDLFLAEVARRLPQSEEALAGIPGASPGQLKKVAPQIVEAVKAGSSAEALPRPRSGNGRGPWGKNAGPPPPEVEDRYERLRAWRKQRAEARKVEVQVIAPNSVLMAIARTDPSDAPALGAVDGMDAFRVEQYGGEMLAVLEAARTAPPPAATPATSLNGVEAARSREKAGAPSTEAPPLQGKLF